MILMVKTPELMTPLKISELPEDLHGELNALCATECSPEKSNSTVSPMAAVVLSGLKTSPPPPTDTLCTAANAPETRAAGATKYLRETILNS